MNPPKPKLDLQVTDEEISIPEEMLATYGIEIEEYGDFLKAVRAIGMQSSDGKSFAEALAACSIPRNAKYTTKWSKLFKAAGDLIHRQLSIHVKNIVTSTVQTQWPAIITRVTKMALNGSDRDALEAAKFLQVFYVGPAMQEAPSSEQEAQDFLKRTKSFDPLKVIHAGTILGDEHQKSISREAVDSSKSNTAAADHPSSA